MANKLINQSKIELEYFDVGGGFPSIYPGMTPPALDIYFNAIHEEFEEIANKFPYIELLCEGTYWGPTRLMHTRGPVAATPSSSLSRDPALRQRLWEESERATGLRFPIAPTATGTVHEAH